ncbi:MAG: hypothetical protein PVS3B2_00090 [Candidatus Dormibacteraceae bacterium]
MTRRTRTQAPAAPPAQLTLSFEPGLAEIYPTLRECVATGVYQRGLGRIAIDLDCAPSNLSVQLSAEGTRKFGVDDLERYIEKTGDHTPIYYLAAKFLHEPAAEHDAALAQLAPILAQLAPLLKKAGIA